MKSILLILLFFIFCSLSGQKRVLQADRIDYADTLHGVVIPDPYKWMEDVHSKRVLKYVKAENKHTKQAIKKTKHLKKDFYNEVSRLRATSRPSIELFEKPDGKYIYYASYKDGSTLHCRRLRDVPDSEEVLLNEKEAFGGKKEYELVFYKLSPNEQNIAFTIFNEYLGDMRTYIKSHKNTNTQIEEFLDAFIISWVNDSIIIYEKIYDDHDSRTNKIYVHKLGETQINDKMIYEQIDKSFEEKLTLSNSKKYVFIEFSNNKGSEIHYIDVEKPEDLKIFTPFENGNHYQVFHNENDTVFYIKTNLNAPNFKIVTTSINKTESKNWVDFISESDDYVIKSIDAFTENYFVITEFGNGSIKLSIIEKQTGTKRPIEFDEIAHNMSFMHVDTLKKTVRFVYNSFITPETYYDYNLETKQLTKLFETQISNYDRSNYAVEYIKISAQDGIIIPTTIIYNKNTPRDGTASIKIDVYASGGSIDNEPIFRPAYFVLLDRGFYWVQSGIRGGGIAYTQRHKDGAGLNAKNKANDLASVAQFLINEKYTSTGKIHATGQSGGGVIIGMTANTYPDLFGSMTLVVPVLDVMFETSENSWEETGNPNKREEFDYMLEFSPYQNVKKQAYPAILLITGLNDKNVPPYQALKMAAKIRENNVGKAPVYLSTDIKGDHYRQDYKKILLPPMFILGLNYKKF